MSSNKSGNKFRLITLRAKFILCTGLLSLGMGVFFCAIYLYSAHHTLDMELSKRGNSIGQNLAYNSKYGVLTKNKEILRTLVKGLRHEHDILDVYIFDADINKLVGERNKDNSIIPEEMVFEHVNECAEKIKVYDGDDYSEYQYLEYGGINFACITRPITVHRITKASSDTSNLDEKLFYAMEEGDRDTKEKIIGYVQIFWSMQRMKEEFRGILYSVLIITLLAIIASVVISMLFANLILRPIKEMNSTALKIATGDLSLRVNVASRDELGQFADSFNYMVDSLQKREQELKNTQGQLVLTEKMASLGMLIAGIAHEINTPTGAIANAAMDLAGKVAVIPELLSPLQGLGEEKMRLIYAAVADFTQERPMLTNSQQSWKKSQQMRQRLIDLGVKNDREVAATLEKFGLLEETKIEQYKELLADPRLVAFLDSAGTVAMTQRICQSSAHKISQIVKALKYYAYTDMDKSELIDINESIENVLVLMHNKFKYQFDVFKKYGDIPKIYCTSEINQVWTNLLSNAYDAVMEKGKDYRGKLGIETGEDNGWVVVKISDNGVGIQPENVAKIFDPFFTTKGIGKGVGLGLSIVSGIVKKHGGNISAESTPEATTFTVLLPKEGYKRVVT